MQNQNKDPKPTRDDFVKTTNWAIAKVNGVSIGHKGGATVMMYKLGNRATGRAHILRFIGGGFGEGVELPLVPEKLSYTTFRTRIPVSFLDFKHVGARLSAITASVGVGFTASVLTIWPGSAHADDPLAKIEVARFTTGLVSIGGQAANYGYATIKWGSGNPDGRFPTVLELDLPYPPIDPMTRVNSKPKEAPLMAIPGDVLFDFDKHDINPAADKFLREAATKIQLRDRGKVEIAGHSDSTGGRAYNMGLSLRRAEAVKRWLVRHDVFGARDFAVTGYGEDRPISPNKWPDGSENPEGQKENRRVEIIFRD